MAGKQIDCDECEKHRADGHNHCRMCGNELNPGWLPKTKLLMTLLTNEKHCGHCGKARNKCTC